MPQPLHILLVEDSEDDALFVMNELRRGGYDPIFQRVETAAGFNAALASGGWDIIIADYNLPMFSGVEALNLLQQTGADLPFIIVSGAIGEEVAVAVMKSGAHDYILKTGLVRLVPAVERELRDAQVRRERRQAETCVTALSKLGQTLSAATTPTEAARVISDVADELFGWDAFTLDLYDAHTGLIQTVLNIDSIKGVRQDVPSTSVDAKPSGIAHRVIISGAELILKKDASVMLSGSVPIGDVIRPSASMMYAPIRYQARVIGVLSVHSYRCDAYDHKGLGTFQTLADYCGGALERISTRAELEIGEERYRKLSDSSPIGIFETDATGYCTYVNPRWTIISGRSMEDSLGAGWAIALHPDDRAQIQSEWMRTVSEGLEWAREFRLLTPVGMVRWVRARGARLISGEGKCTGYVGTIEDITQNKRAADALRAAQERLSYLVSSSPAVLYSLKMVDGELLPTWVSENIAKLTGYGPQETLTSHWWSENLRLHEWSRKLSEKSIADNLTEEYLFRRKDGREFWIRDEKRLIRDAHGNLIEVVGSWSDISDRRLAETELRESRQQLRALAAHLQSVREEERKHITREIHDELGQSLTGFKMDLAWIRARLQKADASFSPEPVLDKIKTMGMLLDETANLVRKLCTELRPGVLDDLGLTAAIEWQAREYQKRTGIVCKTNLDELAVDPERSTALFRIFQEILTNVARHAKASEANIRLSASQTHIVMEVKDNGKGITKDEQAGSKSLGLLGMRERAHILGGTVEISGAPGKGTTVSVRMPLPQISEASISKGHEASRDSVGALPRK